MALDRGRLAKIDRRLMAGLEQDETFRMVKVPVTEAKWSTWKRYCDAAGISMGRAIMGTPVALLPSQPCCNIPT